MKNKMIAILGIALVGAVLFCACAPKEKKNASIETRVMDNNKSIEADINEKSEIQTKEEQTEKADVTEPQQDEQPQEEERDMNVIDPDEYVVEGMSDIEEMRKRAENIPGQSESESTPASQIQEGNVQNYENINTSELQSIFEGTLTWGETAGSSIQAVQTAYQVMKFANDYQVSTLPDGILNGAINETINDFDASQQERIRTNMNTVKEMGSTLFIGDEYAEGLMFDANLRDEIANEMSREFAFDNWNVFFQNM